MKRSIKRAHVATIQAQLEARFVVPEGKVERWPRRVGVRTLVAHQRRQLRHGAERAALGGEAFLVLWELANVGDVVRYMDEYAGPWTARGLT